MPTASKLRIPTANPEPSTVDGGAVDPDNADNARPDDAPSGEAGEATTSSARQAKNSNIGLWTAEEHRLFVEGLECHGKNWAEVATHVGSRTVDQIRSHARQYFEKLANGSPAQWNFAEVAKQKDANTPAAAALPRRTSGRTPKPVVNFGKEVFASAPNASNSTRKSFGRREKKGLRADSRWKAGSKIRHQLVVHEKPRGTSSSEDIAAKARRLANESARAKSGVVAGVPTRAALNQILQECCDVADRKGLSELKRMLEQFLSEAKASGKRSSRASKLEPPSKKSKLAAMTPLPASGSADKKPAVTTKRKEPNFWTEEEDLRLKELVRGFGSGPVKWTRLATEMPGREGKCCQARWSCRLDPSISRSPFTAEEVRAIVRFQADEEKAGKWAELAKVLPGRTREQIRSQWNSMTSHLNSLNSNSKAVSEQRRSTPSTNANSSPGKSNAETTAEMAVGVGGKKPEPISSQANDLSLGRGKEKTLYSAAPKLEPPSNNGTHSARSRKETAGLSDEAKTYLTKWLFDQKAYPYPNRQKKVELCNVLGISDLNQLDSWLCRARKKLMYQTSQSQVPKGVTKGVRDCPTGVRPKIPGGDKPADDAEEEAAVAEKTKLAAITPHPASGSAKKKPASTKKKEPNFWTEEEDSRLKELVSGFGSGPVKWTQLAAEMPGREAKSCQARWSCSVDPSISRSPFTAEEIRVIVRFQADEEKAGKWAELAKVLPGRTAKQVRSRWNSLNSNLKAASEQRQSIPSANTISSPGKSKAETTAEMAMGVGGEIPEPLSRPTLEEEGPEQSSRQPRLKSTGEGLAGNATRSSRRYDSGLSDPDMLDGEEGSSDCEDDDLDLYPDDAKRPTKKRRLEDSDDSDFKPHLPDGDDCGSDDDDDDDPSDLKIPYSVRVERARRGSTKYGTASNNYYTSMFEEDTPRGEILTKVLEKYTKERETVGCVKRSRLLEFLNEAQAEDPGRYGSFDMDPEWLARKLGKEHKKRTRRLTRDPS